MPVNKKTANSKTIDSGKPVHNPQAGQPKAAGQPKPGSEPKPGSKPKAGNKPRTASKAADKSKVAQAKPSLRTVVIDALADMKALEVKFLDVRGLTDIADFMVIASGTSDRHVRSVAQRVVEKTKEAGFRPHGVEGQQDSDWVLIDLNAMIVHVMLPRVREFYGLEKLWDMTATKRAARA
ncbi:MAG TPA: ribosome silencing factor [Steroidobacteraceae bacterium]|nr:ribosome silencing factor [Steroidobacteraceae bacterium]